MKKKNKGVFKYADVAYRVSLPCETSRLRFYIVNISIFERFSNIFRDTQPNNNNII